MKVILSPARGIRECEIEVSCTKPIFEQEILQLTKELKEYSPWDLESALKANEKLAYKAFIDMQDFDFDKASTPAIFAYDGLVYKNIEPFKLSAEVLCYSQKTLRIISALYGLLRPLDAIASYRLEMQSKISIEGKNLYKFWGEKIYNQIYKDGDCVVNLASEEYAKVVRKYLRDCDRFIDIIFYDMVKGKKKVVTTTAKMARGHMVAYILENKIDRPELLKKFEWDGFKYEESLSRSDKFVFYR